MKRERAKTSAAPRRPEARLVPRLPLVMLVALVGLAGLALRCTDSAPQPSGGQVAPAAPVAATAPAWFVDRAAENGLRFQHRSGQGPAPGAAAPGAEDEPRYLLPEITCGGAALFDIDGDGDLDAYLVQAGGVDRAAAERPPNQLFRNLGEGRFEDVTEGSGAGDRGQGNGVACGDFDGDGHLDLFVTNTGPDVLLAGDGTGRFRDVTRAAGLGHSGWSTSAAFFDFDRDGDLDLFVATYLRWSPESERDCHRPHGGADYCLPLVYEAPTADLLYRNDGDGRFTEIGAAAGIARTLGTGLGVLCSDFDGDGWPDVFVANDAMMDRLWINQRDGRFVDRALELGCAVDDEGHAKAGMGVAAEDLDGDGDFELLVGNLAGESDSLFRNQLRGGRGGFADITARSGLGVTRGLTRFGLGFADFDHDGRLDLYLAAGRVARPARRSAGDPYAEVNMVLRGLGREPGRGVEGEAPRFAALEPPGGTASPLRGTSRALALGDVDGDGAVDLLVLERDGPARLLINTAAEGRHWLLLRVLDEKGREALGARLQIELPDRLVHREVRAGGSYQSSSDPRVHLGLGSLTRVERVRVRWPDGVEEHFGPLAADAVQVLRRGTGRSAGS